MNAEMAEMDNLFAPILFELQQNANSHAMPEADAMPMGLGAGSTKTSARDDNLIDLTGDDSDANESDRDADAFVSHSNEQKFMIEKQATSKKRKRELLEKIEELLADEEPGSEALKKLQKHALQCPVCMEGMAKPMSTLCGHVFCAACIQNWINQKHKCPSCQKKLRMKDFHPIYL